MKKSIIIMAFLLLFAGILSAMTVNIGAGTTYNSSTSYPAVYGGYYMNAREQYLISASEFAAGGGGAGNITSIGFNVYAVNGCGLLPNLTISLGHTTESVLSTTFLTGLTQVYTNASYQPVVGMNTHVFSTPFTWDGTSNVVVQVTFDMQTSYTYNTGCYYTATPTYKALYYRSDSTAWNTVTTGTQSYNRPNMAVDMAAGGAIAPFPAVLVSPNNASSYVPLEATLNWTSGGGEPDGYDLYFGTTAEPPFVADLGLVTTYDPTLAYNTTYYWKVVPYNEVGDATNCPVWSFTTTQEGLVGIGNGTDVAPMLPINAFYGYTYSQVIYHQVEIGSAGLITSLAYYWNGAGAGLTSNDWTVYMGHTANTAFATTADWLPLTSLTQVYTGIVDLPATPGWITITLPTPFAYNGSSNLVIAVDENAAGYDSPYGQFYCTTTPEVRGLLYYSDGTNPDPAAPPVAMYLRSSLANVLLQVTPIQAGPPAPPILTYPDNGATGLPIGGFNLTWMPDLINGGAPTYYAIYIAQTEEDIYNGLFFDNVTNLFFDPVADGGITLNYDEDWFWTVEAWNGDGSAVVEPPRRFVIISPPPQISVAPTSLAATVEHGFTTTQQLTITNNGGLPLTYSMNFSDTTVRGGSITPFENAVPIVADTRAAANSERAPFIGPQADPGTRTIFDLQFNYPTVLNDGEYGVATDGNYIYTSDWSSNAGGVDIAKYALDGTYIEEFVVPGATNVRDLAYDGQYFYGAANATTIYQMDFDTHTLIGTITAPVTVRAIAYDSDLDAFWVGNNWAADLRLIDRTGTQLNSIVPAVASFAGLAYDNLSGATPTLWGNTQNGAFANQVVQIDIATGAVLQSFDVTDALLPGLTAGTSSGGMEIFPNMVAGTATLLNLCQNFTIYGLELCDVASWISATPRQGTVAPGGFQVVDVLFDATTLNPGIYTGTYTISHNAPVAAVEVPVQLTVTGIWPAVFAVDPVALAFGNQEQLNPVTQTITITNTGGSNPTPLTIAAGGIYLTGDTEGNFTVNATGLPVSLDHNDTYDFTVTFTPQTLGAKTATLNINDNLTRVLHTVPITGTGIAEATMIPVNLVGTVQGGENVILNWAMSTGIPGAPGWLHYDSGLNVDGIGTGGAAVFDVAMKLDSGTMYNYAGMQIETVKVWPRSANTTYALRIWTGIDGVLAPSELAYEQAFTPTTYNAWNEITLTTPFPITGTQALWIGYNNNVAVIDAATDDYYPAGCDGGPAVAGFGDLISLGTWESMAAAYALNYNWNIQAYVDNTTLLAAPTLLNIPVRERELTREFLTANYPRTSGNPTVPERVLQGFNVYRNNVMINTGLVPTATYTDYGLAAGTYAYTVQAVYYSTTTMSNPVTVVIAPPAPYPLPFLEDWTSASLDTNEWLSGGANWMIATIGNPAPSLMFSWSPQVTNYEIPITSHILGGVGYATVNVSFDLALNNYSLAAENLMSIQVWDGTAWQNVHTFTSLDYTEMGVVNFVNYSYDISAHAANRDFKIRFLAAGVDSYEINYWYIDNINVTGVMGGLDAPVVTIALTGGVPTLNWGAIAGATSYNVYGSANPFAADPWTLLTNTAALTYTYTGTEALRFFKVTANN